ncbi:MAG TPA: caspase family protein [Bradyrhizobium sp.]|uniref:caspase family protein n=1 Tax=Bradyrhizobium sp. TaxID=376 RepID=UPI002B7C5593|nr:caspase family protein [Bradyrhizobium sp.]HLZ05901.1 caspase family protein [Bradyrhizobium sp.]
MRAIAVLLLTGLIATLAPAAALAASRPKVALVIGNARYPDNDVVMNDVTNDSQDMADELKRDGFDVERAVNLTGDGMRQALDRFYAKIQSGGVALLFFDGFGIQTARQTYLLGVDAPIWEKKDVAHDGFNLESIIQEMSNRGALVKIAIIDAARRNPFERRIRRYSAGLAPAVTPSNTLVIYSTALGSVISSARTDHGLFVSELLREIRAPGTTAEQAFRNTQAGVVSVTRGEQVPWLSSSMTTDFAFFGGPAPIPTPGPLPGPGPGPGPGPQPPACVAAAPEPPPSADELANDPKIQELTRRIQQNPGDRIAYYKRGQLYAIKRAYALAVTDFDQAIRLNVRDAEAYNNRCWTRAATNDLLNALRDCNQALRLKPELYDALDSRGLVNLRLGRYQEAISDYNASLQQNPHSSSSMFGRGLALKFSGGDGTADIDQAKSMDHNIAAEFAGYGVNECRP